MGEDVGVLDGFVLGNNEGLLVGDTVVIDVTEVGKCEGFDVG